jgi:large subunit ribosomal protein L30
MAAIAVVRIRGHMRLMKTIEETMSKHLSLTRANHCVVLPKTDEVLGMVQKCKDYVTFGDISAKEIEDLIRGRGRLVGDKPVTEEFLKGATKMGIKELAAAIADGKVRWSSVEGVKPMFRLNPPKKGFKGGTKRSVGAGGNLGNRGKAMPELIARMI